MKKILLLVALLLIALTIAFFTSRAPRLPPEPAAVPGPSTTITPPTHLIQPRFGATSAYLDDSVYVCGGWDALRPLGQVEVINLNRGTIQEAGFSVLPRRFASAVTWRNQILLVGGTPYETGRFIEAVDPASQTSRIITRLPRPRHSAAVIADGDRLIIAGGALDNGRRTADVDVYDLAADAWTNGPPMPTAREGVATVIGRHLYVIGGYDGRNAVTAVERLNLDSMTWEQLPPLPLPQSAHRAIADGDTVYLFGDYRDQDRVLAGNPDTGPWREIDIDYQPARHTAATRVGDLVLVAGGNTSPESPGLATIQSFTLEQLRNAPTRDRANATKKVNVPDSPAQQVVRQAASNLNAITQAEIRGITTMRYTVDGTTYTNTSDYAFVFAPPNRLHLATDSIRLWCDGTNVTTVHRAHQQVGIMRAPDTLAILHFNTVRAYADVLPRGHTALLDPTEGNTLTQNLDLTHAVVEGELPKLGETTTVIAAYSANRATPHERPGVRLFIGQTSGLTLAEQSLPARITTRGDVDETLAIEQILETLDFRFEATLVRMNEPIDPAVFQAPPEDAPERQIDRTRLGTHPLTRYELYERQNRLSNRRHDASFTSLPATLIWSIPNPVEVDFRTLPFGGTSFIPLTHLPAITTGGVAIVNSRDGSIEQIIPLPLTTQSSEINRHLSVLAGDRPEENLLIIRRLLEYTPEKPAGPRHQITAYRADGSIQWEYEDRPNNAFQALHILPRGPGRRQMLALVQNKTVEFVDADFRVLGLIRRGNLFDISFDDRDGDGWVDITLTGDTVQRYEWNESN
jgi:hypothetical protein